MGVTIACNDSSCDHKLRRPGYLENGLRLPDGSGPQLIKLAGGRGSDAKRLRTVGVGIAGRDGRSDVVDGPACKPDKVVVPYLADEVNWVGCMMGSIQMAGHWQGQLPCG